MFTRFLSVALVVCVVLVAVPLASAELIPNTGFTATASSTYAWVMEGETVFTPMHVVSGDGLSGTYPDELHVPSQTGLDGNGHYGMWLTAQSGDISDQWFKVDLGASYDLETLRVWNFDPSSLGESYWGVNQADIYHFDGAGDPGVPGVDVNWTLLGSAGTQTFAAATPSPTTDPFPVSDEIALGVTAQWIGLDINTNHYATDPTGLFAGLSELQFVGASVPGSSTWKTSGMGDWADGDNWTGGFCPHYIEFQESLLADCLGNSLGGGETA